jgi:Zn-dependent protease with chaperone function
MIIFFKFRRLKVRYDQISQFSQCRSDAERQQWPIVIIINILLWILLLLAAWIFVLLFGILTLLFGSIFAEYHVRNFQARGVTIGPDQFSDLYKTLQEVCGKFNYTKPVRLIILPTPYYNAMAMHFIRKRVVVVYSGLLESIIDDPAQVRALLAHELCHCQLNFSFPRRLLLYQSAKFRSARELTCDNAGLVASGESGCRRQPAQQTLRRAATFRNGL